MDKYRKKIRQASPKSVKATKVRTKRKRNKNKSRISFCITCKDRVHHLKKTLPKNLKNTFGFNVEFCILNYNSGDDLDNWIKTSYTKELESGLIRYHRTKKPKYFHMSHAKNMAHKMAKGEILCNLDADTFIHYELCHIILRAVQDKECFLRTIGGLVIIRKQHFLKLGGYSEDFVGWGWEDRDFKMRAARSGLKQIHLHRSYYQRLGHPRGERTRNMTMGYGKSNGYNLVLLNRNNRLQITNVNVEGFGEESEIPRLDKLMEQVGDR